MVTSQIGRQSKSLGTAYLLWFFFGGFGMHRYYVASYTAWRVYLILFVFGMCWLAIPIIGWFGFLVNLSLIWLWELVDAFLLPRLVREYNASVVFDVNARAGRL